MFYALGSALANIFATTINKHLLSREKMNINSFSAWLFIFLFLVTAITLPWLGWVDTEKIFSQYYVFLFLVMIFLASVWNYFFYNCLEKDSLADFQVIAIIQPLLTITLSMIVFSEERSDKVIIATLIAGAALIISHLKRWKIENFAVTIPLFFAILLSSIESLYHKELLDAFSPAALYFARTGVVAIIFISTGLNQMFKVSKSNLYQTLIIAIFAVATVVLSFYGYQTIGIARTSMIMLLYPIGATILSVYLLKERIKRRKVIALVVITACIVYAFSNGL